MSTSLLRPLSRAPKPPAAAGGGGGPSGADAGMVQVLTGVLAAARAAALGLLPFLVLVVLGWASAADAGASAADAVRTAAQAWLLAHHTVLDVPGGVLAFAPLGLLAVPALALFTGGRRVVRAGAVTGLRSAARLCLVTAATYGVLAAVVCVPAASASVRPQPVSAFGGATVLAALAFGAGVLREAGHVRRLRDRLPEHADAVLSAAVAAVTVLIGAGALLAAASLALHLERGARLADALEPGAVGGALLLVLGIFCVPNAVLWASSYAVGAGFSVGTGTVVSPVGVELGAVPAFPLLAGLPQPGAAPVASLAALAAPLLAGVLLAVVLLRRTFFLSPEGAALWAGLSGIVAGGLLGVLAAVSGGAVGGGRLVETGPVALEVAALAAVELGLAAAATAYLLARRQARRAG
jgi:hypothetical protein